MRWKLPALAGITVAALIALNVWLAGEQIDTEPIKAGRSSAGETADGAPEAVSAAAFGDLSGIVERPLFSPTRRKYQPPPVEIPAPEEPVAAPVEPPIQAAPVTETPRLLGVTIVGESGAALLQSSSAASPAWHEKGAAVDGWVITGIDSNSVTFSKGDSSAIRSLYEMGDRHAP